MIDDSKTSKKISILDASIVEFSKGYDRASTLNIIKTAGVSKGLLFHYFGTKKELFLQTFDYAVEILMHEFYDLINYENRDILDRLRQIGFLKADLLQKHPTILDFINNTFYDENKEIKAEIDAYRSKFAENLYLKVLDGIDYSLFRDDIDIKTVIEVILFTIDGFTIKISKTQKTIEQHYKDYGNYIKEFDRYVTLFRNTFYKTEYSVRE